MKIAVIGNGLIGTISGIYLSKKGYDVDCIGPDIESAKKKFKKPERGLNNKINDGYKRFISPKFLRKDLVENKIISDAYFKKKTLNFFSLEIANEMGLAKFWGANLAIKGLNEYIKKLNLTNEEFEFILENIPTLDIKDFYMKKFPNFKKYVHWQSMHRSNKKREYEINSSVLSIYEDKCDINNLPNTNYSSAIFGSEPIDLYNCKRIKGSVESIEFDLDKGDSLTNIIINTGDKIIKKKYNYIFLASGAIGSYRIIKNSIDNKKSKKIFNKIKHHPMISTLTFIPDLPHPKRHFGMSNLDLKLKVDKNEIFINFHPLESFLKVKLGFYKKLKKFFFIKLLLNLIEKTATLPFTPFWILRRIYIAGIYLPSKFTSSYIGYENNQIKIIGGLKSNYEKYLKNKLWGEIRLSLKNKNIFSLLLRPIKIELGSDFHYSSTLVKYTNKKGIVNLKNKNKNIIILDSSSSRILPTPNPSFYFLCRAIKLLREI